MLTGVELSPLVRATGLSSPPLYHLNDPVSIGPSHYRVYTYELVMRAIASMTRREAEGHSSRRGKP